MKRNLQSLQCEIYGSRTDGSVQALLTGTPGPSPLHRRTLQEGLRKCFLAVVEAFVR